MIDAVADCAQVIVDATRARDKVPEVIHMPRTVQPGGDQRGRPGYAPVEPRAAGCHPGRMEGAAELLLAALEPLIPDPRVLAAIAVVPRTAFVAPELAGRAWENVPLPIAEGQTISQPLVVARMLSLLELDPGDRVLDVGTGSGWHAALLSRLAGEVWGIERHPGLVAHAREALAAAGIRGVRIVCGDGTRGLPEHGPWDAINVAAAAYEGIPPALEEQLAPGGRLVAPVGTGEQQSMWRVCRGPDGELHREEHEPVRFVPLVSGRETDRGVTPVADA